ncbi:MAG: hypothetical protein IJU55_00065 [Selenomonadaceae bacterium]|nr:hypothetical protein [Selenomonadaceae bacterium]
MKKIILILATIFAVNIFGGFSSVEASTAVGKSPANISNSVQAKLMARRAAQVIAIKNNGGKVPQVISENWNPATGEYTIEY